LYNDICIIGLGTVGGFLAKNLSDLETTKKLVLIDYDIVEPKNVATSIYLKKDIGEFKTNALRKKIISDTKVQCINKEFQEGITKIPKCDLVLDCRDLTYTRKTLIDCRLSISSNNLLLDCRKNVTYEKLEKGLYSDNLNKRKVEASLLHATSLIENKLFDKILKKQKVHIIPLDYSEENTKKSLMKDNSDIIFDNHTFSQKLVNLPSKCDEIIDINKTKELTVCVGNPIKPYIQQVIPINNLRNINDIISEFSYLMSSLPYNYYVITIVKNGTSFTLEIIPDSGAA